MQSKFSIEFCRRIAKRAISYMQILKCMFIRAQCLESMNLNHLCPIPKSLLVVNRVLKEFEQLFVRSNRRRVRLNRNYYAYVRQQIKLLVLIDEVMHIMVVLHFQYLLVHHQHRLLYMSPCNTVVDASLYCKKKNAIQVHELRKLNISLPDTASWFRYEWILKKFP